MGRFGASFKAGLLSARPFRVLKLGFPAAAGGPVYFTGQGVYIPGAATLPRVTRWEPAGISASEVPATMQIPETKVAVEDRDHGLRNILEGAVDVSFVPAGVYWALPGLAEASWQPILLGSLYAWRYSGITAELTIKPDSHALEFDDVPRVKLTAGDWPLIHASSKGAFAPIVYGIHDASALSGKGMIPCPNGRFDPTAGYYYVVSLGWLKSVDRLYLGGVAKTITTQWNWSKIIAGGKPYTVVFLIGITPLATDVITVDCQGLTTLADGTGALISTPPDILKHALTNFVFGDWPTPGGAAWLTDATAPIDVTEFATAAAWASSFGWEGAFRFGGTTTAQRGQDVVTAWGNSFPSCRLWWTERNQMACGPLRHHDSRAGLYPSDPWLREEDLLGGPEDSFAHSDSSDQFVSRISASHLYGEADGKFWATLEVQDPTMARRAQRSYSLAFSARRVI